MRRFQRVLGLLVFAALILAACAQGPSPAGNVPASIVGAWSSPSGGAPLYLLFLEEGDFRIAGDMGILFDSPVATGTYTYRAGRLIFAQMSIGAAVCVQQGEYVLSQYQDGSQAVMHLSRVTDDCAARRSIFENTEWTKVPAEG